jgi:hypothetical protein
MSAKANETPPPSIQPLPGADAGTAAVLNALRGLRFGSIEVVIHNGRIVQVERREKVRIDGAS